LIQEVISQENEQTAIEVNCISVDETAADKWIALCKRIAHAERETIPNNKWLIRHLYDLHCIEEKKMLSDKFEQLIPVLLLQDKERSKNNDSYFFEHTLEQIQYGFLQLKDNSVWKSHYQDFTKNMVFQTNPPTYSESLETLQDLHKRTIFAIQESALLQKIT